MIQLLGNPIKWPGGARCAVAFTWDMDADSSLHLDNPARADTMISTASYLRYGPKIAIARLIKIYRRYNLKQTFFVPGWCIERYPEAVDQILEAGHEVGLHGYLHERLNELSFEAEKYWLERGIEAYRKHIGHNPAGWRAPTYTFSKHSLKLLVENGLTYDSSLMGDDQPQLLSCDAGTMIELPTSWALDDWPQYMHNEDYHFMMPIKAPDEAIRVFEAEFEAAWSHGGLWISVWHPFLSGRLSRVGAVIALLERILEKGNVWMAPLGEIAEYARDLARSGEWTPREDRLPFDESPIPELTTTLPP